jgi:hypothetical protein
MEQVHLVIVTPVSMAARVDLQTPVDATTAHVKKVSGEENELIFIQIFHSWNWVVCVLLWFIMIMWF